MDKYSDNHVVQSLIKKETESFEYNNPEVLDNVSFGLKIFVLKKALSKRAYIHAVKVQPSKKLKVW